MQPQTVLKVGLVSLLVGCEPMPDPGQPFGPVGVGAPPVSEDLAPVGGERPWADDPSWVEPEPFAMTSEEMISGPAPAADPPDEAPTEPGAEEVEPNLPSAARPPAPPAGVTPPPPPGGGWPLRLVATVPGAHPPRAILGLPDGSEVVVSPGAMLPEVGVVVVSVSADHAEVARIEPRGDHAAIAPITLFTQY